MKTYFPEHLRKDWLLHVSGFLTWFLISFLMLQNTLTNQEFILKGMAFLAFYMCFAIVVTKKWPVNTAKYKLLSLLLSQIFIVFILISFDNFNIAAILLVLIATQLPSMFSRQQALLIMLSISLGHFFIILNGDVSDTFFRIILYFFLQIFGFSTIEIVHREAKAKEDLAVINQELLATRYMLKTSSERQERLRISRDLHDVIGHQLTALSLNLEVASHKVPLEYKPLITQNLVQAKNLLTDVREVVKEMRTTEQFDLAVTLQGLVDQFPNCALDIQSLPEIDSLSLKQQLMFCLQEGSSNALRHGKASKLTLSGEKNEQRLTLSLMDNGNSVNPASIRNKSHQFGSGLKGMQERLKPFNGNVELVFLASGCTLKITVTDSYD
ncbi:MAG: signal transduction histidine kinase [Alteromonadaceae bacterium]|jgi:signal transduction histidine kinase